MRTAVRCLLVVVGTAVSGCKAPTQVDNGLRTSPPVLSITATTQVVVDSTGAPALEVVAALYNPTTSHVQVFAVPQCPLAVRLFPDPTGVYMVGTFPSGCQSGLATIDIAPGDSATLVRVFPSDSLALLAPGTYGVNAEVATYSYVSAVWAGAVTLPLPSQR